MNLTKTQFQRLRWLHENGGKGFLDQYGRVVANGQRVPQGAQLAWLNLVAKGFIAGAESHLTITQEGYKALDRDNDKSLLQAANAKGTEQRVG